MHISKMAFNAETHICSELEYKFSFKIIDAKINNFERKLLFQAFLYIFSDI